MRPSAPRQRSHSGGTGRAAGAATRFGFGSVMPTASDGPPAGRSSTAGAGVGDGVAVGAGDAVAIGAGGTAGSSPPLRASTTATTIAASATTSAASTARRNRREGTPCTPTG